MNNHHTYRTALGLALLISVSGLFRAAFAADTLTVPDPMLAYPLAGKFEPSQGRITPVPLGPYRFVKIDGRIGYQPTGLQSQLRIPTDLHQRNEGSITLSLCPLETLAVASARPKYLEKDPQAQRFRLMSDAPPRGSEVEPIFDWQWRSIWHPQMLVMYGPRRPDFDLVPCVMVEHLPLLKNTWYQVTYTWNLSEHRLRAYVNGILCGTTDYAFKAPTPRPELYLGNSDMAFADVEFYDRELSGVQVAAAFAREDQTTKPAVMADLRRLFTVQPRPRADWSPDATWTLARRTSFTKPEDLNGWRQQGCTIEEFKMKAMETTPEGLLMETPDAIGIETRMYLWGPENYEGDIAVQFDFRPEKDFGLALFIVEASGMQREDFITDHPPRTTGSMGTIISDRVRNYHWEYFRRTPDVRADLGTQILVKNPWTQPLGMATLPRLEVGVWHRLLFVKEGTHIRGAMDGQWIFDVQDDPFSNNGPDFNFGRIGFRQMYQTRLRYRDLQVWTRNPGVEVVSQSPDSVPAHLSQP